MTVIGATLTSGGNTIAALNSGSPTASSPGSSQFGLRVTASGGSGAVQNPYNGSSGNYAYTSTAGASTTVALSGAASALTTYTLYYLANISATQQAGSYTTTLTYVATATF